MSKHNICLVEKSEGYRHFSDEKSALSVAMTVYSEYLE